MACLTGIRRPHGRRTAVLGLSSLGILAGSLVRDVGFARGGYFARATAGTLALRAASLALGFVCHLFLTRLLGAHDYGVYVSALAWTNALSVPATLGAERLIVRQIAVYRARRDWALWRG